VLKTFFKVDNIDSSISELINNIEYLENIKNYKRTIVDVPFNDDYREIFDVAKDDLENIEDKDISEIYCITFPDGNRYVGSCKRLLKNGETNGVLRRYRYHFSNCYNNDIATSKILKLYELKYYDKMVCEKIYVCNSKLETYYEDLFIEKLCTVFPHGLNLKTNGTLSTITKLSEFTCNRSSQLQKGKHRPNKIIRKNEDDNKLPKCIERHIDDDGNENYRVSHSITGIDKSFCSKLFTNAEKYQMALDLLAKCEDAIGDETKILEIKNSIKSKLQRQRHDNSLPKYIKAKKRNDQIVGYEVYKPGFSSKCFTSSSMSLEEKYSSAIEHLSTLI